MNGKGQIEHISKEFYTTGEAASLCAVTPNAVLKWVRAGKIPASRTPGGHHRIPREAVIKMLEGKFSRLEIKTTVDSQFEYCWEFHANRGKIKDGCRQCIVYRSRSGRCYEIAKLPVEAEHSRIYCQNSCDDCEYYEMIKSHVPNVMIVTNQDEVQSIFEKHAAHFNFNLRFSDCEYSSSMLIESFRPDYVVIDCSFGKERSRELTKHLSADPRIPFARLLMVGDDQDFHQIVNRLSLPT